MTPATEPAWSLALAAVEQHKAVQKPQELAELIDLFRTNDFVPHHVLEIGSQEGGTFWLWCQLADPQARLMAIDSDGKRFRMPGASTQKRFYTSADSHAPLAMVGVCRFFPGPWLDLLFIDGDHSYAGVKQDYEDYGALVRDGGYIVFHDVAENPHPDISEVHHFWRELEGDKWCAIWPHATNVWNGNVLPAKSCGIGALRVAR